MASMFAAEAKCVDARSRTWRFGTQLLRGSAARRIFHTRPTADEASQPGARSRTLDWHTCCARGSASHRIFRMEPMPDAQTCSRHACTGHRTCMRSSAPSHSLRPGRARVVLDGRRPRLCCWIRVFGLVGIIDSTFQVQAIPYLPVQGARKQIPKHTLPTHVKHKMCNVQVTANAQLYMVG